MPGSIMPSISILPMTVVAWAATYFLHSTLLIGCTWLLTRLLGMRGLAVQDKLWKVALTGALFSCTMQAGLGDGAVAPRIALPPVSSPAVSAVNGNTTPAAVAADLSDRRWPPRSTLGRSIPGLARFPESGAVQAMLAHVGAAAREPRRRILPLHWQWFLLLLWGLGAAGCTVGLARQLTSLKKRFRGRREITSGPLYRIFRDLVASRYNRSGAVRLTVSHRIAVPVACGIRRPEICLPSSLARETDPGQLKCVLAHELAHIVRRDQVWLLAARLVEGIFFFQPLVRLARRCFQETAEFICDGEAVRQTGERVPLARTLHEMALRQVSTTTATTMPGISGKGSPLNRRIEMILDKNRPAASRARWFGPLAVALILTFAFLAPGVAVGEDPPPRPDDVLTEEAAADEAERELAAEEAMREAEREMAAEEVAMELAGREMAAKEEAMALAEREMAAEEEAKALAEQEVRRMQQEARERHREITRRHAEISRHHRDVARRQAEEIRQRRAVFHSEETARRAQRRGLERAIRQLNGSLAGELTDEQRERLSAMKRDMEEKLGDLDQAGGIERAVLESDPIARPEELN